MSEATRPRLRLLRTSVFYLAAWSPVAAVASMIGVLFASSPLNTGDFLTDPRGVLRVLFLAYAFGAVPSVLNGMIVAVISPGTARPWMLPVVSAICGLLLFGVMGIWAVKSFGLFAILGAVAGGVCGLAVMLKRRWFEGPGTTGDRPAA